MKHTAVVPIYQPSRPPRHDQCKISELDFFCLKTNLMLDSSTPTLMEHFFKYAC